MEALNEQKQTIEALQNALATLNQIPTAQLIVIENGIITTHLNWYENWYETGWKALKLSPAKNAKKLKSK